MPYGVVNKHSSICELQVEFMEIWSPVTINCNMDKNCGEIYGLEYDITKMSTPEVASELRSDTEIAGLWLTGMKHCVIKNNLRNVLLFLWLQNIFRFFISQEPNILNSMHLTYCS